MTKNPDLNGPDSPHFNLPDPESKPVAWEEVEEGRYMPKRVRGSCQGRALGWTFVVPSSGSDGNVDCQEENEENEES